MMVVETEKQKWDRKASILSLDEQSSLLYWYPKIQWVLPVPETRIVKLPFDWKYIDEMPESKITKFKAAANALDYPVFIKTDAASDKHGWEDAAIVYNEDELVRKIQRTLEFNACAGICGLRWEAIVFRKFLHLDSKFKAFKGMPVAPERRYFVVDEEVICHHPYWPPDSIAEVKWHNPPLPDNWRELLDEMQQEDEMEVFKLKNYAKMFNYRVPGFWAVDFARDIKGYWWLIDAQRGEQSFHWDPCPVGDVWNKDQRERAIREKEIREKQEKEGSDLNSMIKYVPKE